MRNVKKNIFVRLSEKLEKLRPDTEVLVPNEGWVNAIRTSINMSQKQLSKKMGVTSEAVRQLEKREAAGGISLNALRDVASALDMQLVYAIVPKEGTLEDYVEEKARNLAQKMVLRTNQQMRLEAQEIDNEKLREAVNEATAELVRELNSKLWDLK